ncbi:MAG: hypothetical protein H6978_11780 [Gammaproteobacteria bacterium]|nr:hypothetical protein [Gammaproteobacteria bacterium]
MIFSLRSIFDPYGRRTLIINADRAAVYTARGGRMTQALIFAADDDGLEQFERYLRETPAMPTCVLVDVVEEEYRQDTVPHVIGRDRQSVLERKQNRLFRGTTYCHAIVQGREKEGRRDDRVLLTALTKPALITPWVTRLSLAKIPLVGIYSLALISARLARKLNATGRNVLLITLQSGSGLRQTFFRDQQFRLSRLASIPRLGSAPFSSYLMGELDKLRRYLNSIAMTAPEAPLDVYILSHGDYLTELENHCKSGPDERFHLIDVADAGRKVGLSADIRSPFSDALFAGLLAAHVPTNQYASQDETKYFQLHRARTWLTGASVALLLGSILVSGLNFIGGVALKQQALDAQSKAAFYQQRYESARRDLPPTPVEPRSIKTAVDIIDTVRQYKSTPVPMLQTVSAVLSDQAGIVLERLDWRASRDPNASAIDMRPGAPNAAETVAADFPYFHVAQLTGRVEPFDGDYRNAIAAIDAFTNALAARENIVSVQTVELPVNTRSDQRLTGTVASRSGTTNARFSVRVVMGVRHGPG